ncbi:uncharacterized protein H6S33_003827 [Morchella sextelata]|uniref:uncharacterized protein n=1 Tax=Morchella sextelata TaxID=1174677 RepID=UPI001D05B95A|nr:uncharacterized protein H6S33_003827 [Morchella sextelata]KAH0606166.1 hypothetical protein H6S33_003827 [Morchella sextelata]
MACASTREPYKHPKNNLYHAPPLIPTWDNSRKVEEGDISARFRPASSQVEPAPLLETMSPSTSNPPAHPPIPTQNPTQTSDARPIPPHLRVLAVKSASIVSKEEIASKKEIARTKDTSSEKPNDKTQIEQTLAKDEEQILENRPAIYIPPHLRPVIPRAANETENKPKTWIPPHLRKPEVAKSVGPHSKGSNSVGPLARSSNVPFVATLSNDPVVLKLAHQTFSQDHHGGVNLEEPDKQLIKPVSQQTEAVREGSENQIEIRSSDVRSQKPFLLINSEKDKSVSPTSSPKTCSANEPSPAHSLPPFPLSQIPKYSRQEGIQFTNQTNNHPHGQPRTQSYGQHRTVLYGQPRTPSCGQPRTLSHGQLQSPQNSRRDGTSTLNCSNSSPKNSQPFRSHNSGQFMLNHQEIRKRKSYTQYLTKSRHIPPNPCLPFEPVHRFYQGDTEIYGKCSSIKSTELNEDYKNVAALIAIGDRESKRTEFAIPSHEEIWRHMELVTLQSRQNRSNSDEGNEEGHEEHEEYEEKEARHEQEDPQVEEDAPKSNITPVKSVEQPSEIVADESERNLRSIFLIGLPHNMTLKQISKICSGSGLIESIQISRENGIALVNFVVALVAKQFYEATKAKGVTLVFLDENKNTVKKQIIVKMDIQGTLVPQEVLDAIETLNASRVLDILGWDRKSLENSVGLDGECEAGLTDLLLRLTSQYVSRYLDTHHGEPKVQDVSWEVNQYGYLQATLIFAGIQDAMIVHRYMEEDHRLDGCFISFGKDP